MASGARAAAARSRAAFDEWGRPLPEMARILIRAGSLRLSPNVVSASTRGLTSLPLHLDACAPSCQWMVGRAAHNTSGRELPLWCPSAHESTTVPGRPSCDEHPERHAVRLGHPARE